MTWTPKQLRVLAQHENCQPELRPQGPHMGLYCAQHGTWIKWVNPDDREKIQNLMNCGK
jgi:hypothetical protein